jgi:hypothetical protein
MRTTEYLEAAQACPLIWYSSQSQGYATRKGSKYPLRGLLVGKRRGGKVAILPERLLGNRAAIRGLARKSTRKHLAGWVIKTVEEADGK